jgi:hypothetical protein
MEMASNVNPEAPLEFSNSNISSNFIIGACVLFPFPIEYNNRRRM